MAEVLPRFSSHVMQEGLEEQACLDSFEDGYSEEDRSKGSSSVQEAVHRVLHHCPYRAEMVVVVGHLVWDIEWVKTWGLESGEDSFQ